MRKKLFAISKRSKQRCLNWAIHKRTTCRMHGGRSRGPRTQAGKEKSRQAVLKHGSCTKKAMAEHKEAMQLIKMSKDILALRNKVFESPAHLDDAPKPAHPFLHC